MIHFRFPETVSADNSASWSGPTDTLSKWPFGGGGGVNLLQQKTPLLLRKQNWTTWEIRKISPAEPSWPLPEAQTQASLRIPFQADASCRLFLHPLCTSLSYCAINSLSGKGLTPLLPWWPIGVPWRRIGQICLRMLGTRAWACCGCPRGSETASLPPFSSLPNTEIMMRWKC